MSKDLTYPAYAAAIPLLRGWRGVVTGRTTHRELVIKWECEHSHVYKDTAEHCAAVSRRRYLKTGSW